MRGVWIAGVILIACSALADSQPPAPGGLKTNADNLQIIESTNSQSADKSNSTARQATPVPSPQETQNDIGASRDNDSPNGWWSVGAGLIGVFVSVLTLFVVWRQANIADKQADLMDGLNNIMVGQSTVMDSTLAEARRANDAAYTAANETLNRMQAQLDLARSEFLSTHRPRIRVRDFNCDPITEGSPARIFFAIANVGDTNAHIISMAVSLQFKQYGSWEKPLEFRAKETKNFKILSSGDRLGSEAESEPIDATRIANMKTQNTVLCIAGVIFYMGDDKVYRCTRFVREYDSFKNRFKASDDPEEDYED